MKQNESHYLERLFALELEEGIQEYSDTQTDFPLVDVPDGLSAQLHAIADSASTGGNAAIPPVKKLWPTISSIAASLLIALIGFQFYQQQQTIQQLEQAQTDLATALHYLGEANRIAQAQVRDSLEDNMKKAGVEPALDVGRESLLPTLRELESDDQFDDDNTTSPNIYQRKRTL